MPLLVNNLEADHFMVIVEEPFFIKVPDPELFAVVTVGCC